MKKLLLIMALVILSGCGSDEQQQKVFEERPARVFENYSSSGKYGVCTPNVARVEEMLDGQDYRLEFWSDHHGNIVEIHLDGAAYFFTWSEGTYCSSRSYFNQELAK